MIAGHGGVRQLLNNGWVHLFVIEDDGATIVRYVPGGAWEAAAC